MSYERATDDLEKVLGNVLSAAAQPPPTTPETSAEGHDPDRTIRAAVTPEGRIETVEIGPRAARLDSHEIAERAMAAINAALDAWAARSPGPASEGPAADLDGRLREAQDRSLRQLSEYTRSLRDLMNSFEPR
ncbi:hypothetical protein [Actinomadura sp. 9N215]|uniref:hypothetical protein n=1 Tax=Actinomadura sp. 9N215 TaxID=3375150 RepID=UPI0037886E09